MCTGTAGLGLPGDLRASPDCPTGILAGKRSAHVSKTDLNAEHLGSWVLPAYLVLGALCSEGVPGERGCVWAPWVSGALAGRSVGKGSR